MLITHYCRTHIFHTFWISVRMLLDTVNPYTQSLLQQCTMSYAVSQRPECLRAAAEEEAEVKVDLPPLGIAHPTGQLRPGLPRAFKATERFKF